MVEKPITDIETNNGNNPSDIDAEQLYLDVQERINFIKENFYIGMTENEIKDLLGYTYESIVNDSEDGTYYDLKYQEFLSRPFIQEARYTDIDIKNIKNNKIGLQIFIGMTIEEQAKRISFIYLEDNKVMMKFIDENGEETLFVES